MKLYNTLTRKKEEFIPQVPNTVKMYSCGPTVYNYFHIGNARPFIVFDTLRRYLEYKGFMVEFAQNFTDIDDKMIKKANEEGISVKELADTYIDEYFKDAKGLGIKEATYHPRATENIDSIIDMINNLINKGYAYSVQGDVYFSTKKFEEYGKLSKQSLEDLESGARIDIDDRKQDPMDFALWKAKKEGEPSWESPWGLGRPGWHIECSVMANKFLAETIDIHSGGQDLIFPHHENEIAQSEAANGKPFAKYWLHNGFININNEKMSKSKGNFFTVRDIVQNFEYEVLRFFMLSSQYRHPINFSKELLEQSQSGLSRIYNCINNLDYLKDKEDLIEINSIEGVFRCKILDFKKDFINAMDDDLNTAEAIGVIFEIVKEINSNISATSKSSKKIIEFCIELIKELGDVLGILQKDQNNEFDSKIQVLIDERQQARKDKNFKRSDEIRDELLSLGITLQDTPQGVKVVVNK